MVFWSLISEMPCKTYTSPQKVLKLLNCSQITGFFPENKNCRKGAHFSCEILYISSESNFSKLQGKSKALLPSLLSLLPVDDISSLVEMSSDYWLLLLETSWDMYLLSTGTGEGVVDMSNGIETSCVLCGPLWNRDFAQFTQSSL